MPTLQQWLNALYVDRTLRVDSSAELLADVAQKQAVRQSRLARQGKPPCPMKALTGVSIFDPPVAVTVKPITLLHSIGRITCPPVPNLADLSSTWAIVRYIWAFSPVVGHSTMLSLSDVAREIDFHQKALLSDEVGVGMTHYLMTTFMNTPNAIDVAVALRSPGWNIYRRYRASPDFLFFDDLMQMVYVVESKGNQTSYQATLEQLRRGTEQVPSIGFSDGTRASSLIIAACMGKNETCAYIVDPPSQEGKDRWDPGVPGKSERVSGNEWRVKDRVRFDTDARLLSRAKLLSFARDYQLAYDHLPFEVPAKRIGSAGPFPDLETLETEQGDFIGAREYAGRFGGVELRVYRGLLSSIHKELAKHEVRPDVAPKTVKPLVVPDSYTRRFKERAFLTEFMTSTKGIRVQSYCSDGTIFIVDVHQ